MKYPIEPLLGLQFVEQGRTEHSGQFGVTLVRRAPGFAAGDIRGDRGAWVQGGDRLERSDLVGQRDQPRRGRRAGRKLRKGCSPALAGFQQYRRQHGGGADFQEGASVVDSISVFRGRQATFPMPRICGFHYGPSLNKRIAVRWL
ncbi:hypothetical protein D9M69_610520 [compost metagenome]